VWRDVTGHRTGAGEYLVVSHEAGIRGERLTVYLESGDAEPIPVRVVESRPIVSDGSVLHQLRLSPVEEESFSRRDATRDNGVEAE
jgi:hypothetical protein